MAHATAQAAKPLYLSPQAHRVEINGVEHAFYPASVKAAFKLRSVARPIAQAFATLLAPSGENTGKKIERVRNKAGENLEKTEISAIEPKLAEFRSGQRDASVSLVVEAITDPKNQELFAELIADSLRDEIARPVQAKDWQPFLDMDVPIAKRFLVALIEANREVLGPFEAKVAAAAASTLGSLDRHQPVESPQTAG